MTAVPASIPVLRWAAQRAHLHDDELVARFPKWPLWLSGQAQPTLRQLEAFARRTQTAFGYFFLAQPPALTLPIPDFRTLRDQVLAEPSNNLLDTLYLCQQRQDWYRDYVRMNGLAPPTFVGSTDRDTAHETVAQTIRKTLGLSVEMRSRWPTQIDALRQLITKTEEVGILIMVSSIVGNNSNRRLDVGEFRGFALVDDLAPLIFINGADSKAAQMFTLAHELAHLWLGASGVSDSQAGVIPEQHTERWCNQVAAELLMPMQDLWRAYQPNVPIAHEIQNLSRLFKVSTLVALRRLFDAKIIDQNTLWQHYRKEQDRLHRREQRGSKGGDFYRSLGVRTSKRFARAVIRSTLEGQTLFQDAFRMLNIRKTATFHEAARELGVSA